MAFRVSSLYNNSENTPFTIDRTAIVTIAIRRRHLYGSGLLLYQIFCHSEYFIVLENIKKCLISPSKLVRWRFWILIMILQILSDFWLWKWDFFGQFKTLWFTWLLLVILVVLVILVIRIRIDIDFLLMFVW